MLACVPRDARAVLDYATGTGTLALAVVQRCPAARVVGLDLSESMLAVARRRAREAGSQDRVRFLQGDAESWEPEPGAFDAVLAGYLPKYVAMDRWLAQVAQALKPRGVLVAYDFTYPQSALARAGWEAWWRVLGPRLRHDPAWRAVAEELPGLVRRTRWVDAMLEALPRQGFERVRSRPLSIGIATLVEASRAAFSPAGTTDAVARESTRGGAPGPTSGVPD